MRAGLQITRLTALREPPSCDLRNARPTATQGIRHIRTLTHIIIIIKRGWQHKAGRERLTPYQYEDPNPTTPTHRKKEEKGKTVGDKK